MTLYGRAAHNVVLPPQGWAGAHPATRIPVAVRAAAIAMCGVWRKDRLTVHQSIAEVGTHAPEAIPALFSVLDEVLPERIWAPVRPGCAWCGTTLGTTSASVMAGELICRPCADQASTWR